MRYAFLFIALLLASITIAQTGAEYYKKANEFFDKDDFANALRQINKALQSDSTNYDYLMFKAGNLRELKEHQNTFDTYSKVLDLYPGDIKALNNRGMLLASLQEFEYSIMDYNRALVLVTVDSQKLSLLINRGVSKIGLRNFLGAYDDFMKAYLMDSLNIGVLNNLATVCDEVGKGDQTLNYLFKILAIDSSFIGSYVNIGFKYQENGDHKKAIEYFSKAISMDENEALSYSNRSYNRLKLGDLAGALTDVDRSILLYPANSYAFRNRALIYIAMKENIKACADLEKALDLGYTKMYGSEAEELKLKHCTEKRN